MTNEESFQPIEPAKEGAETSTPQSKPKPTQKAQPVKPGERLGSVDTLRGAALLGILAMNIIIFGWPFSGYENPRFSGGENAANLASWWVCTLVFSGKMMSLFSMLFGAGLVLMSDRAVARGASILGTYYRRIFWLLIIGLIHAYLIWAGDILVMYALCGLLLYWFRKLSPRTLIVIAVIMLLIQSLLGYGFSFYANFMRGIANEVQVELDAGREPEEEWKKEVHTGWEEEMRPLLEPNQEDVDKEIEIYRGGYVEIVKHRAPEVFFFQIFGFFLFGLWGAGGRMLLGMALMKIGVFGAGMAPGFYRGMALFGYGFGVPLTAIGAAILAANDYSAIDGASGAFLVSLGMVPTALGHAAVVMMICRSGILQWLTTRLAAVGRLALTNYLMQSILCTLIMYGYGFGMFGRLDRPGLWLIVLGVWILQLVISPIWLKYFRYGPAEWLWRSLTYWKLQPIRISPQPTTN